MFNSRYLPFFQAALGEIEMLLTRHEHDSHHYRLLHHVLDQLRRDFFQDKLIPSLLVPAMAWKALGQTHERSLDILNASQILFYAFLDITDDAEDQDLNPRYWKVLGPALAINAGTSLLFLSQLMLEQLQECPRRQSQIHPLQQLFMRAGWRLTVGQHRDLAGARLAPLAPEEVLHTHRLKAGSSVRLYLESAAVLARAQPVHQEALAQLGEIWGCILQIRGDWQNLDAAWSSDLANGIESYPIALLRSVLPPEEQEKLAQFLSLARSEKPAHLYLRHLCNRHALHHQVNATLTALREAAEAEVARLQGCETRELLDFLGRMKDLEALKGDR